MLAACATHDDVANMQPTGSEFTVALYDGYVDLMQKEEGFYDWIDAAHWRDKAQMAGNGEVVMPEDPTDSFWYIPDENELNELIAERPRLLAAATASRISPRGPRSLMTAGSKKQKKVRFVPTVASPNGSRASLPSVVLNT